LHVTCYPTAHVPVGAVRALAVLVFCNPVYLVGEFVVLEVVLLEQGLKLDVPLPGHRVP
jgi:hypothetical protein